MDPVIGLIFLAVLLIVLSSVFSDNSGGEGGGFLSGLIGGLIGGGLIYKFFSGSNESEEAEIDSAETSLSESGSTIDNLRRRAQENAENGGSNSEPPSPQQIYRAVSEIEKPEKTFEKLSKSSEHDLEKLISNAKEFEELKDEEREKISQIKEALGPKGDVNHRLSQLISNGEDLVLKDDIDSIEEVIETVIAEFGEIEEKLGEIENNQSRHQNLLSEKESELIQDLKENKEILKDVENCLNIISEAEEAERYISNIIERSQSESQKLNLTEQEIRNLESVLQEILRMEKSIVKELEELERIEEETEEITEQEINDIKQIIKEDEELYKKIDQASGKFEDKGYEDKYREIKNLIERLKRILKNLGAEFEQEEQEEEKIREEVSEAEQEVSDETERESEKVSEAEAENRSKPVDQRDVVRDSGTRNNVSTWDFENAQDWRDYLDSPTTYSGGIQNINSYDKNKLFSYPNWDNGGPSYTAPKQGFKLHISAYPKEGLEVAKAFAPILQTNDIRHKIIHSLDEMELREERYGTDDLQIKKFFTIYVPSGVDDQSFRKDPRNSEVNKNAMFPNTEKAREIVELLINNIDDKILIGGPEIEGKRNKHELTLNTKEFRVGNSRIFLKYDLCGHGDISVEGQDLDKFVESNNDIYRGDYLEHLFSDERKVERVKDSIISEPNDAIIGIDGRIAGAYYLPPPEAIEKAKEIANSY
jgi:hypothetical protein